VLPEIPCLLTVKDWHCWKDHYPKAGVLFDILVSVFFLFIRLSA